MSIMSRLRSAVLRWLLTYDVEYTYTKDTAMHLKKRPFRAFGTDAGYDLVVTKPISIVPGETVNVHTGISVKADRPVWFMLIGRSSTVRKYGLIVDIGVIDHGYTGELYAKVYNTSNEKIIHIEPNLRLAQIIPIPHVVCRFKEVDTLSIKQGQRGENGFGSTGS